MPRNAVPGPDQAIGWVVAWACFFINFITAGLARSSGVLFVALINDYGITREEATTPFSLRISVRSISGPVVGLLGQRYSYRSVISVGGVVAALGSVLCAFAPSIPWITFFWGIIHGIGFGLSTVLHMMVIGEYFDKYKASALGFGYSGDSFGTFVFPVIIEHLLDNYSVDGMFLIMGAIVLHIVPMALLLNSPPWKRKEQIQKNIVNADINEYNTHVISNEQQLNGKTNEGFITSDEFLLEHNKCNTATSNPILVSGSWEFDKSDELSNTRYRACSVIDPKLSENGNRTPTNTEEDISCINTVDSLCTGVSNSLNTEQNHTKDCDSLCGEIRALSRQKTTEQDSENPVEASTDSPKYKRATSLIEQITFDIAEKIRSASFASQVAQEGFITLVDNERKEDENEDVATNSPKSISCKHLDEIPTSKDKSKPDIQKSTTLLKEENNSTNKRSVLNIFIHTNLRPLFFLISITMAAFAYLLVGVLTVIIDYATDQNISMDMSKYLLIAYSLTDLIGRLTCGIIIDKKIVKMKTYSFLVLMISSISVGVFPLNNSFYYMVLCISIFGFFQGGTAIMFPILITTYMEKDEESIAMGCLNFYSGVLMLGMGRMIGFFRDNIGAYDGVFYILAILGFAVGSLWLAEPLLLKFEETHLKKRRLSSTATKL